MNDSIFNIGFVLFALIIGFLLWFTNKTYRNLSSFTSDISSKYNNMERLLLDLRDGTKSFYKEKRESPRTADSITATIADTDTSAEFMKVINISDSGALLRTSQKFKPGRTIDLKIYLPLFAQPIDVKAKVVWSNPCEPTGKTPRFDMGVKYLNIARIDREKLNETIALLLKKTR